MKYGNAVDGHSVQDANLESITRLVVLPEARRESTAWMATYLAGALARAQEQWAAA